VSDSEWVKRSLQVWWLRLWDFEIWRFGDLEVLKFRNFDFRFSVFDFGILDLVFAILEFWNFGNVKCEVWNFFINVRCGAQRFHLLNLKNFRLFDLLTIFTILSMGTISVTFVTLYFSILHCIDILAFWHHFIIVHFADWVSWVSVCVCEWPATHNAAFQLSQTCSFAAFQLSSFPSFFLPSRFHSAFSSLTDSQSQSQSQSQSESGVDWPPTHLLTPNERRTNDDERRWTTTMNDDERWTMNDGTTNGERRMMNGRRRTMNDERRTTMTFGSHCVWWSPTVQRFDSERRNSDTLTGLWKIDCDDFAWWYEEPTVSKERKLLLWSTACLLS